MRKEKKRKLLVDSRHLLLDITLTEKQICEILDISETTLRQLYKDTFNMTPRKYIFQVKMKKAKTLLQAGKLSISEISYALGYLNSSKFSSAFKRKYGITPSEYRKNLFLKCE